MRIAAVLATAVPVALVAGLALAVGTGAMPLGVRGEWEWQRLPRAISYSGIDVAVGAVVVALYAGLAALGLRSLQGTPTRRREALWLAALLLAAIGVQAAVPAAAPEGYGLAKWALALHNPGSSGYYTVAKTKVGDPWTFLAGYPEWIRGQDSLHIGTHPPGLLLVQHALIRGMEAHPATARLVLNHIPDSLDRAFGLIAQHDPLPRADRAALVLTGALILLACAATVVPLYLLARASLPASAAWSAATLWPLVPAAILFQPAADTAFPLLSTTALALAAQAARRASWAAATVAGAVLALGMSFTLAFLAVGLVVALVLGGATENSIRRRLGLIAATGLGFLVPTLAAWAVTRANPFLIWWWNQRNHARFYVEYPRSYLAWVAANPVELAVAIGLPAAVWCLLGLASLRRPSTGRSDR